MIELSAIQVGDWVEVGLPGGRIVKGTVRGHRCGDLGLLVGNHFVSVVQLVSRGRTTFLRLAPEVELLSHMGTLV